MFSGRCPILRRAGVIAERPPAGCIVRRDEVPPLGRSRSTHNTITLHCTLPLLHQQNSSAPTVSFRYSHSSSCFRTQNFILELFGFDWNEPKESLIFPSSCICSMFSVGPAVSRGSIWVSPRFRKISLNPKCLTR